MFSRCLKIGAGLLSSAPDRSKGTVQSIFVAGAPKIRPLPTATRGERQDDPPSDVAVEHERRAAWTHFGCSARTLLKRRRGAAHGPAGQGDRGERRTKARPEDPRRTP